MTIINASIKDLVYDEYFVPNGARVSLVLAPPPLLTSTFLELGAKISIGALAAYIAIGDLFVCRQHRQTNNPGICIGNGVRAVPLANSYY